ncbi:hypothetical protein MARSALSMR5_01870 [Marinobacter salarius]|uniref:Uncharacterized protein n=1 Tax=Marinobacter salarius TaxID=1420917 RepID=A0A1W6K951_9GAMM|nr:hypothetical protein MARSALSMR5_01870 [Marinobacter salarius]
MLRLPTCIDRERNRWDSDKYQDADHEDEHQNQRPDKRSGRIRQEPDRPG